MAYLLIALYFYLLHRNTQYYAASLSDYLLNMFIWLAGTVIPAGYLLSEFSLMSKPVAWGAFAVLMALLQGVWVRRLASRSSFSLASDAKRSFRNLNTTIHSAGISERVAIYVLIAGVGITALLNFYAQLFAYPNEWDSMTGHLVKCAYYLQNGNMNRVHATTWTVDFYPNSLPTLQMFFYQIFGEMGFKVIHYLSYWVFALSSYKITLQLSGNARASLIVGLLAALLPSALIQATTTETDLVFSAYLGILVYFLLQFARRPSLWNASLITLALGIWMSHKVTFILALPPIFLITLLVIWQSRTFFTLKHVLQIGVLFIVSLLIYVLPNGYLANVKEVKKLRIGSLSAPEEVMHWHGIEDYSKQEKMENFLLNTLRYKSDFLNLDGLRNADFGRQLNNYFRIPFDAYFKRFPLEMDKYWVVSPFRLEQNSPPYFFKERPYWGIISFGLVIPAIIVMLLSLFRKDLADDKFRRNMSIAFLVCGAMHFLSLCFSAPYDPIKGRYFMNMSIWFLPLIVYLLRKNVGMYLIFAAVFIGFSAICGLLFRDLIPLTGEKTIANMTRIEQLLRSRPDLTPAYEKFEELVPEDAIVALGTQQEHEDYEYPLWGPKFRRTMIPIHPFRSAVKPIPAAAEYLFYSEGVIPYQDGDIRLNTLPDDKPETVAESTFFLRKLK